MKLIDDDGTEIKISEETARNIRESQWVKKGERRFDDIRVSRRDGDGLCYIIRISVLDNSKEGCPMEDFSLGNSGPLPGNTLCMSDARAMANYILELCNELEKR